MTEEEEMIAHQDRLKKATAEIQERVHNKVRDVMHLEPKLDIDSVIVTTIYFELARLQIRIEDYENRNTLK